MLRTRALIPIVVMLTVAAGGAAAAGGSAPHTNGNGKGKGGSGGTTPVTTYSGGIGGPACADPQPEVCIAASFVTASSGSLVARSEIQRSVGAQDAERNAAGAYVGRQFRIGGGVTSVTGTLRFSHIGASASAKTLDGRAYAQGLLVADIFDSGCGGDYTCGAPGQRATVVVASDWDRANQSLPLQSADSSTTQVMQVTLTMPNGGYLPAGYISIAGMAFSDAMIMPASCVTTDAPQLCDSSPVTHTGTVKAAIQAQLDSVTWTTS